MNPVYRLCRWIAILLLLAVACSAATTPPRPITTVAPAYPAEFTEDLIEGSAVLQMVINEQGRVEQAEVKSADHAAFGREALKVVEGWVFEPATVDGQPVARKVSLPFQFKPSMDKKLNKLFGRTVFARFSEEPIPMKELGQRPRPIVRPQPLYPPSKRGSGEEMRVRMRFIIGKDGATYNPDILDDVDRIWVIPALATVVGMRFEPIKKDGEAVLVQVTLPILISEKPPPPQGPKGAGAGG